jgi:hypothetical protein
VAFAYLLFVGPTEVLLPFARRGHRIVAAGHLVRSGERPRGGRHDRLGDGEASAAVTFAFLCLPGMRSPKQLVVTT